MPGKGLTSLSHHIDLEWMREAYRKTRKDGAVGIDGQTAQEYEGDLEGRLRSLIDRAKSGDAYRAPAVRRVYIPKGDKGKKRPIGIPTLEDKVLQRAVVMALEPVYEEDFLDCSYGFRPGRSAHQALEELRKRLMEMGGGWVLEVDIREYFDTVGHKHLKEMLHKRIRDGVLLRLIGKWLKAGVVEEGRVYYPEAGTPQGGVISPLLANIYLHEVLDTWFAEQVKPRLKGKAFMVRFADDMVMVFSHQGDAQRVRAVLPKRLHKYGLSLHPDKTRIVCLRHPLSEDRRDKGSGTFDFLGFTTYWGKSRKGNWVMRHKTATDRLNRAIKDMAGWCRKVRHQEVKEQHALVVKKVRGHYAYYGITGNMRSLSIFSEQARGAWKKWLCRRSQKRKGWDYFDKIVQRYPLPPPRIVHSYVA